ncbi:ferredoxin--NADP reductase [Terracidiphilus gabretensis]|uniref:ferredoxin--NADP reductase n=1 Tax=Terracidiphilus gabretensis TaxID=1577687 RepID=UPI001E426471|nr:FAD-binding oxidoreductase [Terracidiphilus gabretensis]
MSTDLERTLYTARLERKECISESAQCYHFEFVVDNVVDFPFTAGQFVSLVATDPSGKEQTRAYSIASAHNSGRSGNVRSGNILDLCANRTEGGFFSNFLADIPIGSIIDMHGPYGYFVLKQPVTDSILISTGTGIAPIRGFTQWLFPENGPDAGQDRSEGKEIWCVYGTRHESELYYREELEALAAKHPNFHYIPTLSRAGEEWSGLRGHVQEHVARIIEERAAKLGIALPLAPVDPAIRPNDLKFDINAYVCGLSNMITSVREKLASYGWHRKQIVAERYD